MARGISIEEVKKDALFMQILKVIQLEKPNSKVYADLNDKDYYRDFHVSDTTDEDCEKIGQLLKPGYTIIEAGNDMDYPFFIHPIVFPEVLDSLTDVTEV